MTHPASSARLSANSVGRGRRSGWPRGENILHQFLVGARAHGEHLRWWQSRRSSPHRRIFFKSIADMIYIHSMNLNSLDLNLLTALDALLREANVSRAALRIGLSQPATSHALQRLRDIFGDPAAGAHRRADGADAAGASAARAAGAGARPGARAVHTRRFRRRAQRAAFRLMMPDLAVELLMPPLMEKVTQARAQRPHRRGAVAGPCDLPRRVRTHHRSRDLDRQRLQGLSPPAALHRQRRAGGAARPSRGREAEATRVSWPRGMSA